MQSEKLLLTHSHTHTHSALVLAGIETAMHKINLKKTGKECRLVPESEPERVLSDLRFMAYDMSFMTEKIRNHKSYGIPARPARLPETPAGGHHISLEECQSEL